MNYVITIPKDSLREIEDYAKDLHLIVQCVYTNIHSITVEIIGKQSDVKKLISYTYR